MNTDTAIKVTNLSKVFPLRHPRTNENGEAVHEHWALKDVSFEIKKGESVGIIGPNGSGKSTLLQILAGVTKPTKGKVEIRGKVASILDIGAGFHPELSGRENVFLNGQIHGFSKKEIESKFDEIVDFSGIGNFIEEPVKNYSNGMYLRLAFSIMAHLDFDVYLFDEVMRVGDIGFALKSKEKIDSLALQNRTVVVVSHSMQEIQEQEKFIRFEKGKLLAISSKKDILNQYTEKNILDNDQVIHTSNVTITDFSKYPASEDVKLLKVELLQDGEGEFVSDKEFKFIIEFEKKNDDIIDFFVIVSDLQGNSLLTISPLLQNIRSVDRFTYIYTCNIPASLFGFQVYSINLYFVKYINTLFKENKININKNAMTDIKRSVSKIMNLIFFKSSFGITNYSLDIELLDLTAGLMPDFKWKIEKQ